MIGRNKYVMFGAACVGVLLGTVVIETIRILLILLCLPVFGLRCDSLTIGMFTFRRQNGRLRFAHGDFSWFVRYTSSAAEPGDKSFDESAAASKFSLFRLVILMLVSGVITALSIHDWALFFDHTDTFLNDVMCMFSICTWIYVFDDIVAILRTRDSMSRGLGGYVNQISNMLRSGVSFEELQLRPIEQLGFEDALDIEKILYLTIYCTYLLDTGRTEEMQEPIYNLNLMLRKQDFDMHYAMAYLMLIYYYSWYNSNSADAEYFYNKAGTAIVTDAEANTKRVLAYYAYGIQREPQKARYFLDKAKAGIDRYASGSPAENRLERRLINELDRILNEEGY